MYGQDEAWLIERPDHVLAQRMVDTGLAADRRVDLGEQRRGNLEKRHATQVHGGCEAREVSDHAPA